MTATTDALVDFLLARIAEDEARARAAADVAPSPWEVADRGWMASLYCDGSDQRLLVLDQDQCPGRKVPGDVLRLIEWFDPARVLAECEAKRQIVEAATAWTEQDEDDAYSAWAAAGGGFEGGPPHDAHRRCGDRVSRRVLAALALPYARHPGYRDEWRP